MTTTKHTPGKLVPFWNPNLIGTEQLVNGKTRVLLKCDNINGEPGEERATVERIIKCWNACEGINPEAVPELYRAAWSFVECIGHSQEPERLQDLIEALKKAEGK